MTFRVAAGLAGALLVVVGASRTVGVGAQQPGASAPGVPVRASAAMMSDAAQNALVEEYCSTCHDRVTKSGSLVLTGFNVASPFLSSELLEKMIRKVRSGQMPPANAERPAPEERSAFVEALEARADAKAGTLNDPGWRPFQRLNRAEYQRVIKDLVAVDIDPSAILPPDTASGGFDNIADVQSVSPTLITAYLRGAASVNRNSTERYRQAAPESTRCGNSRCGSANSHPPQDLVPAVDVDGADGALADRDANKERPEPDPQDSADVANQIRGREREEAPADDDRQFVPIDQVRNARNLDRMSFRQSLVEAQRR